MSFDTNIKLKSEILTELGYSMDSSPIIISRIEGYIKDGVYKINDIARAEVDYDADRAARALLKSYCIYANGQILNMWSENYLTDINDLHHHYRVKEFQENAEC